MIEVPDGNDANISVRNALIRRSDPYRDLRWEHDFPHKIITDTRSDLLLDMDLTGKVHLDMAWI